LFICTHPILTMREKREGGRRGKGGGGDMVAYFSQTKSCKRKKRRKKRGRIKFKPKWRKEGREDASLHFGSGGERKRVNVQTRKKKTVEEGRKKKTQVNVPSPHIFLWKKKKEKRGSKVTQRGRVEGGEKKCMLTSFFCGEGERGRMLNQVENSKGGEERGIQQRRFSCGQGREKRRKEWSSARSIKRCWVGEKRKRDARFLILCGAPVGGKKGKKKGVR